MTWRAWFLCAVMLLAHAVPLKSQRFQTSTGTFTLDTTRRSFLEGVKSCAELDLSLVTVAELPQLHAKLITDSPDGAKRFAELVSNASGGSGAQEGWSLWTWHEYRACHAAKLLTDKDNKAGYFVTATRRCDWRLATVCVAKKDVQAVGSTSASEWYDRYFREGGTGGLEPLSRSAPSSITLVPGTVVYGGADLPEASLVALGLKADLNCTRCTNITYGNFMSVYDDSERFWERGPVVSAQFSVYDGGEGVGNHKLVAIKLIREGDLDAEGDGEELRNQRSPINDPLGLDAVVLGVTSSYRRVLHEVVSKYDYVVSVLGCFRLHDRQSSPAWDTGIKLLSEHVEMLYFITRTGRQYQFGRGGCTHWFREDAPPGGYLAGMAGAHLNSSQWRQAGRDMTMLRLVDLPWIRQVRFVWAVAANGTAATNRTAAANGTAAANKTAAANGTAATNRTVADPAGVRSSTPPPASTIRYAPTLSEPVCRGLPSLEIAFQYDLTWPPACGADALSSVCPSNSCCGKRVWVNDGAASAAAGDSNSTNTGAAYKGFEMYTCGSEARDCWKCHDGYGMCGQAPEARFSMFVRSGPAAGDGSPPDADAAAATAAAATTSVYFLSAHGMQLPYTNATQYCRTAGHLGLPWVMVTFDDVVSWFTSMGTRQGWYDKLAAMSSGMDKFWVESDVGERGGTCLQVVYGNRLPDGSGDAADAFTFRPTPCRSDIASPVFCKLSPEWRAGGAVTAGAAWAAGPHTLTWSPVVGRPSNATNCLSSRKDRALLWPTAAAAATTPDGAVADVAVPPAYRSPTLANAAAADDATRAAVDAAYAAARAADAAAAIITAVAGAADGLSTAVLTQPITRIAVSLSTQIPDLLNAVLAVSAIKVWADDGDIDDSSVRAVTAGTEGTDGWHVFELARGEVVVAVSGCFGAVVERLVFRTSTGRRWSTPFVANSVCSASFMEEAPPGGYLVGIKVDFVGGWIESAKLLWGQPPPAAPPPDGPQTSPSPSSQETETTPPSLIIGVTVAGAAGLALMLVACWGWLARRRRNPDLVSSSSPAKSCCWCGGSWRGRRLFAGGKGEGGAAGSGHPRPSPPPPPPADVCFVESNLGAYEERLNGLMRAGEAPANGTDGGGGGATVATMVAIEITDETKLKLSSAITELHAEMSGRQEQLHVASLLGQGSFGVVYLGIWRGLQVAIKTMVVRDALVGAEGRRRHRALLEAAISKSLQHPNVVTTYAAEVVRLVAVAQRPLAGGSGNAAAAAGSSASGTTSETRGSAALSTGDGEDAAAAAKSASNPTGDVYKLYIIQEYCNVGSLSAALGAGVVGSVASGGASSLCALTLALDVACGMSHVHSKNIVHGDLSGGNVLLSSCGLGHPGGDGARGGRGGGGVGGGGALHKSLHGLWRPPFLAKVSDFGLSLYMSQGETHVSNCFQGTPAYLAPEVVSRGHVSKAVDVWAFGVLLLELCHGAKIGELRARFGPTPPAPSVPLPPGGGGGGEGAPHWAVLPANCPAGVAELIFACFCKEPSGRPPFVEVVRVLVEVLQQEHARYRGVQVSAASAAGTS